MSIEHLVATLNNKNPESLFDSMNLEADVIIANQCDENSSTYKKKNGHNIKIVNTKTRGISINRNIGISESSGDICVISDDDMDYVNNYSNIIKKAFTELSDADVIIFNIDTIGGQINRRKNTKIKRVRKYNFMNYGSARIAFKRNAIIKNNIWFSLLFGTGSKYSSGEDTIFLHDCLKKHLKIYTYPKTIAAVDQTTSTWFNGYDEKFFFDKGALIGQIFPFLKQVFFFTYFPFRFGGNLGYKDKVRLLRSGDKMYKKNIDFKQWKKHYE